MEAVLKEIQQLHDRMVIEPKHMEILSKKDRENALQYLMFLKEKRKGKLKDTGAPADEKKTFSHRQGQSKRSHGRDQITAPDMSD